MALQTKKPAAKRAKAPARARPVAGRQARPSGEVEKLRADLEEARAFIVLQSVLESLIAAMWPEWKEERTYRDWPTECAWKLQVFKYQFERMKARAEAAEGKGSISRVAATHLLRKLFSEEGTALGLARYDAQRAEDTERHQEFAEAFERELAKFVERHVPVDATLQADVDKWQDAAAKNFDEYMKAGRELLEGRETIEALRKKLDEAHENLDAAQGDCSHGAHGPWCREWERMKQQAASAEETLSRCRAALEGPLPHETGMRIAKAIREQSDGSIGPVVDWSDTELAEIVTRVLAEDRSARR